MAMQELVLNAQEIVCPADLAAAVLAYVPSNLHSKIYLAGIDADFDTAVSAKKNITVKTGPATVDGLLQAVTLSRGTTDTNVQSTAFHYVAARAAYYKAAVAAGTTLPAGTIPADTWGIYRLVIDTAGTISILAGAANFTTGYASEAAAIAANPAVTADNADMGRVTVLTNAGNPFIGDTDALAGGASGNVAATTNYVSATAITLTQYGMVKRWDFTNGPYFRALPLIIPFAKGVSLVVELESSGGAQTGTVSVWVANGP